MINAIIIPKNKDNGKFTLIERFIKKKRVISINESSKIHIYIYPNTSKEIEKMQNAVFLEGLEKIARMCAKDMVKFVFLDEALYAKEGMVQFFEQFNAALITGCSIFFNQAEKIIDSYLKVHKDKKDSIETGVFWQNITNSSYEFLLRLSKKSKYITLFTKDLDYGNELLEVLYENNGVSLRVTDDFLGESKNVDIMFVIDNPKTLFELNNLSQTAVVYNLSSRQYYNKNLMFKVIDRIFFTTSLDGVGIYDYIGEIDQRAAEFLCKVFSIGENEFDLYFNRIAGKNKRCCI